MIRSQNRDGCTPGESSDHGTASRSSSRGYPSCSRGDSDESSSLLPIWKDDGSSSIDYETTGHNDFPGIPSTLEFTVLLGPEFDRHEEEKHLLAALVSCSSLSCNMEVSGDDFPSAPYTDRISEVAEDVMTSADRLNSFRRRLHSSMDTENASLLESQCSSLAQSPALSQVSSPYSRSRIFRKFSPRFVMTLAAMTIVFLSVHDSIQSSRRYYRKQYQLLSSDSFDRREEVAFPIVEVQVRSNEMGTRTRTTYQHPPEGTIASRNALPAELPKFYLARFESPHTNSLRGSKAINNLAMARAKEHPRPVFVPDVSLPGGGFRKPLERFVFDEAGGPQLHRDRHILEVQEPPSLSYPGWVSRVIGLVVIAKLLGTKWRERRRCLIGGPPASRDE
mmetsp:Transcript_1306/g.3321  ORF Transcript_1306/g.3321 Transcript_1306/m.3321 type:complete len:392 (+) Transcript_1306:185-1360(+)